MTKYAAHPTLYKGVMFRSRLEAKYAAYFDQRGWSWTYEPLDLKGYTPDFMVDIPWPAGTLPPIVGGVLVEVKPATQVGQLKAPIQRMVRAWNGPWMVVGADPNLCVFGIGRHTPKRRALRDEDPEAWAAASNLTQWMPIKSEALAICAKCGRQDHLLHRHACKG